MENQPKRIYNNHTQPCEYISKRTLKKCTCKARQQFDGKYLCGDHTPKRMLKERETQLARYYNNKVYTQMEAFEKVQ